MVYAEWRACERFGITPPKMKRRWDQLSTVQKCDLIAYNQIREMEEVQRDQSLVSALAGRPQV